MSGLGVGVVLVFALSGCIRIDNDMTFRRDGKVDVRYGYSLNVQAIQDIVGVKSVPEFRSNVKAQVTKFKPTWPAGVNGSVSFADTGKFVGFTSEFKGATVAQLKPIGLMLGKLENSMTDSGGSGSDSGLTVTSKSDGQMSLFGNLTITNDGSKISVKANPVDSSLTDPPKAGSDAGPDAAVGAILKKYAPQAVVTLTFPGKIISSNGKVKGKTVTWTAGIDTKTLPAVVASAK
jgi:hypothetical protein